MRILRFIVEGQTIKKDPTANFEGIVKGTKGYLLAGFALSPEWIGCKIAASFWKLGKEYAVPLKRNVCEIPDEALTWDNFSVSLTGIKDGTILKTNEVIVAQEG